MVRVVRQVGIAIGSLVIAWLALSLVGGVLWSTTGFDDSGATWAVPLIATIATLVLGGLIYRDIIRRETREP